MFVCVGDDVDVGVGAVVAVEVTVTVNEISGVVVAVTVEVVVGKSGVLVGRAGGVMVGTFGTDRRCPV